MTYPNHYGTFHTFADHPVGPWRFCACAAPALTNLAELISRTAGHPYEVNRRWRHDVPPAHLPNDPDHLHVRVDKTGTPQAPIEPPVVARHTADHEDRYDSQIRALLSDLRNRPAASAGLLDGFANRACHRCNLTTPALRWAHEMYETGFNQYHGWYTQHAALRAGFHRSFDVAASCAALDLVALREQAAPQFGVLPDEAAKNAHKRWRRLFQDEARTEFGYRKVGEGFIAETQLANLTAELYPDLSLIRHHRPDWLEGLELDIWIPALGPAGVGIEYQGQQHYHPIKAWGGEAALRQLQLRDERKRQLCRTRGVVLVEVVFTEPLTRPHLERKLSDALGPADR